MQTKMCIHLSRDEQKNWQAVRAHSSRNFAFVLLKKYFKTQEDQNNGQAARENSHEKRVSTRKTGGRERRSTVAASENVDLSLIGGN